MKNNIILLLSIIFTISTSAQVVYQTYTVTGTETWDINTYPNGVLIEEQLNIEAGGTLTISANVVVKFSPLATAYVKMGGKLFLYGATLAANTNYAWNGIRVIGNPNYNFNQLAYHGLIVMDNNASIGGANSAIEFHGTYSGTGGGTGIIKNSTFKNNNCAIVQGPSPKCRIVIDNCNFIVDDNYLSNYYWTGEVWFNYNIAPPSIFAQQAVLYINNSTFSCLFSNNNLGGNATIFSLGGNIQIKNSDFIDC